MITSLLLTDLGGTLGLEQADLLLKTCLIKLNCLVFAAEFINLLLDFIILRRGLGD